MAAIIVLLAVVAYVWWRIYATNMNVPAKAEQWLSTRDALRFALDNDLPLRGQQTVIYVNPQRGEPLPSAE